MVKGIILEFPITHFYMILNVQDVLEEKERFITGNFSVILSAHSGSKKFVASYWHWRCKAQRLW